MPGAKPSPNAKRVQRAKKIERQGIALISRAVGKEPRLERLPEQPGDVRRTCADVRKAGRVLGYRPTTAVEDGIPRFVRWYEEAHGHPA